MLIIYFYKVLIIVIVLHPFLSTAPSTGFSLIPVSVRLLCTAPTLLLAFRETFPDRLLSVTLSV